MKTFIKGTTFGSITVGNQTYDYDILIRSDGSVEKRKKKLSKEVYGTSHTVSLNEALFIYEEGLPLLIVGNGQYGQLGLSEEAEIFFKEKGIKVLLSETPKAVREFNRAGSPCAGIFHITC